MARLAILVAPGCAPHITQPGNRGQTIFFCEEDYRSYLALMAEWCGRRGLRVRADCLMPNDVRLIGAASSEDALRAPIGEAHGR